MALSICQVLYIQPIFKDIGFPSIEDVSVVLGDNLTAINSVGNNSARSRTKQIDIRLKFCGEVLAAGKLQIKFIQTAQNIADIFTKPLPAPRFRQFRKEIVKDFRILITSGNKATANILATFEEFQK